MNDYETTNAVLQQALSLLEGISLPDPDMEEPLFEAQISIGRVMDMCEDRA